MTTVLDSALAQWRRPVMRGRAEFPATWAGEREVTVAAGGTTAALESAWRECTHQAAPPDATIAAATRAHFSQGRGCGGDVSAATGEVFWRLPASGTTGINSCSRVATDDPLSG